MGVDLWWVRHDGIGGHVWVRPPEFRALVEEMLAQGMASEGESGDPERPGIPVQKLAEGAIVTPDEIEAALALASPQAAMDDQKLWHDWLAFLEGALAHGGLQVR